MPIVSKEERLAANIEASKRVGGIGAVSRSDQASSNYPRQVKMVMSERQGFHKET